MDIFCDNDASRLPEDSAVVREVWHRGTRNMQRPESVTVAVVMLAPTDLDLSMEPDDAIPEECRFPSHASCPFHPHGWPSAGRLKAKTAMRSMLLLSSLFVQVACASSGIDYARPAPATRETSSVTYYDRNHDGVVDLELHVPGYCDDCDWALVDTDFNGRYEKRVRWSYALVKEVVDLPVPENVALTAGQPALSGWED